MGLAAYCVAGRGGTAAAEKAEEDDDSSGSPSSCSEDSGAGSIDAAGLGRKSRWSAWGEGRRPEGSLSKARRTPEDEREMEKEKRTEREERRSTRDAKVNTQKVFLVF